jgi:hypothetical protein
MMALPAAFTVSQSIDEAFERLQFSPEALTPQHLVSARRSIRLMLDDWNNDSVDFWKVQSGIQHVQTILEASFVPPVGVIDILDMAVLRDTYTTPMVTLSRADWFAIPDKATVKGMANRFWLERLIAGLTCHIYPFAENSTDILIYDAMIQFNDSSILQGSADVPPLWNEAFTAGLTAKLAEKFRPQVFADKMALAGGPFMPTGAYARARTGARERADTIMILHKGRRQRR